MHAKKPFRLPRALPFDRKHRELLGLRVGKPKLGLPEPQSDPLQAFLERNALRFDALLEACDPAAIAVTDREENTSANQDEYRTGRNEKRTAPMRVRFRDAILNQKVGQTSVSRIRRKPLPDGNS